MRVSALRAADYSADERRLLTTFANQAALAIDRARLIEEATRAAALEEVDRLKSALLAAVSHDLRTPLASIKASATSLLQDDVQWDAATQREFLTAIDEETDRLTRLVSNLLDLTRIQGGALKPEKEWNEIGEVIDNVADRLAPLIQTHPLRIDIAPDLPPVAFDFVEIAQVLTNLIENAAKYSDPGAEIAVRAERDGRHRPRLRDGSRLRHPGGGSPVRLRYLLSGAARGAGAAHRRHGDRPRHLQGVRRGARRDDHRRIRGRGGLDLHLHPADHAVAGRARIRARRGSEECMSAPPIRVLVVDDEPQILRALRAALKGHGYDVQTAADGEEALDLLALHPPDIVILDLVMPGKSGFDVVREVRGWSQSAQRRPPSSSSRRAARIGTK